MLTEPEALQRVLETVLPLPVVRVPLDAGALGSYLGQTVLATVPLPGFDNSAMDGYAVRAADTLTPGPGPLPVVGEQPAGRSRHLTLPPGAAIRVFTGASMPVGADAVIMQEDVDVIGQEEGGENEAATPPATPPATPAPPRSILCREPVEPGENLRRAGTDLCVGQKLCTAGARVTPALLGVLASQGLREIALHARARVAVVTTGDELAAPGQPLEAGQLYNSNGVMLEGLVRQTGVAADARAHHHHLPDDLAQTTAGLERLIADHDFLVLSGGVSVGDHDCVKPALAALGHRVDFWRVRVKPGKPVLYVAARRPDGGVCHVFGLPGNPVSTFVTFHLFVRPALLCASGAAPEHLAPPRVHATLASPAHNRGDRPHYLRGNYHAGVFTPLGVQQSHALFGLSRANALLRLEAGADLPAGGVVDHVLLVG